MSQHLDYLVILSASQVGGLIDSQSHRSPFLYSNTQHLDYFASLLSSRVGRLANPLISPFQLREPIMLLSPMPTLYTHHSFFAAYKITPPIKDLLRFELHEGIYPLLS
jgi:hypothetical protein